MKIDLNKVYDILVLFGAKEDERLDFIYHHTKSKYPCTEWRFCGEFGFGGKYRSEWNEVTAYSEDITPKIQKRLDACNTLLKTMK
jgi:hypothetical protein